MFICVLYLVTARETEELNKPVDFSLSESVELILDLVKLQRILCKYFLFEFSFCHQMLVTNVIHNC